MWMVRVCVTFWVLPTHLYNNDFVCIIMCMWSNHMLIVILMSLQWHQETMTISMLNNDYKHHKTDSITIHTTTIRCYFLRFWISVRLLQLQKPHNCPSHQERHSQVTRERRRKTRKHYTVQDMEKHTMASRNAPGALAVPKWALENAQDKLYNI